MTDLLRLATAGSVDDGKSTLVGRLLHDTKSVLADQLEAVQAASRNRGLEQADLALLTDGLRAEREQGITIDVAYRYFATARRKFILADTPGHLQYTRNMVTGASTAQLAVLLVDARKGVLEQTRRHAVVSALLGVPHLVLAVNKMDLVGYDEQVFEGIAAEFTGYARGLGVPDATAIPVSALVGDNVAERSATMPWYDGPTLLEHLEQVPVDEEPATRALRFPVQYVIRPQSAEFPDYRGYAGRLTQGMVRVGDQVVVLPAGRRTTVTAIDTFDGELDMARHPQSVTLRLADDIDISRGDLICGAEEVPAPTQDLDATVCWLDERPLFPRQRVLVRHGTRTVRALVRQVADRLDIQTLLRTEQPGSLGLNEIGRVLIRTAEPLPVDRYVHHRTNGSFLVIDEADGSTLGAGMVGDPLREAGATLAESWGGAP
jgi:sulfate adenylyltransferase subunit 1